jgi:transglutaminase-like putative cysteine protease
VGLSDPFEKARALYFYVLSRVAYDKSGQGWGQGDVLYVCKAGKGNCTDFHSFFIALALAEGIPARFRMGFSLPAEANGSIGSYHCWAEFHAPSRGWVPVDISEAWKRPAKAPYYFGTLDQNRVLVSTGRQIILSPRQKGEPLNYLSRPYAEINGEPLLDLELTRTYRNLPEGT